MWWFWLLISIAGYVAGFLASGIVYSYTFNAQNSDRVDLIWAMAVWPVFLPSYTVTKMGLSYIEFLERNRAKRTKGNVLSKNVRPLTPREEWKDS